MARAAPLLRKSHALCPDSRAPAHGSASQVTSHILLRSELSRVLHLQPHDAKISTNIYFLLRKGSLFLPCLPIQSSASSCKTWRKGSCPCPQSCLAAEPSLCVTRGDDFALSCREGAGRACSCTGGGGRGWRAATSHQGAAP